MDAIRSSLEAICNAANVYLNNINARPDPWITLTSLVDHNGALNPDARDKVVMCIYNVTRETTINTYQTTVSSNQTGTTSTALSVVAPPLYIDLHIMFMANFTEKNYSDGLTALSRVIGYFQQTPFFNPDNTTGLDANIDKLTLEFENLSPVDVNYVMGMLGTRYLPSAFYKLRMIPFVATAMQSRAYAVSGAGLAKSGGGS